MELVFSPEFQRLRYVRLCNINSLYLTGASEPKRFEHCLGVYHLADQWTKSRRLTQRQADVVRAAAILHDIQTGPFGHTFQYVMEDNPFEQRFEHASLDSGVRNRFLQLVEAGAHFSGQKFAVYGLLGELASDVFAAIEGKGEFGPIISGSIDLDNLDNVVRLAFHMGLCSDADRTLPIEVTPLIQPFADGLAAENSALPLFERWFHIRRRLYEFLLLDRGEFAAKAMLTLAVEQAADAQILGPDDWRLTDDGLLDALHDRSVGENQIISQIIKRLRVGNLFECIGIWQTPMVNEYKRLSESLNKRDLETIIDEKISSSFSARFRTCLHYILDKKKTCRSISVRNINTGNEEKVGYDSETLLVGAFVTNWRATPLSSGERQKTREIVINTLEANGLRMLAIAPEPLANPIGNPGLFE